MNIAEQYIEDIQSEKVLSCNYVKACIGRHASDLEKAPDAAYPYYFDADAGNRAITIARLHKHTKGALANKPFDLQPFQAFILYTVFGWKRKSNDCRRFTKVYIEMARKGGKSEFAAIVANIGLLFDGEFGAEIYTAATKRDQAKIVFERSHYMIRQLMKESAAIGSTARVLQYNINVPSTNSKMEALAADSKSLDGLLPHMAIVDEYHAHRDNSLVKVLETGMGGREQPLLFIITTAGFNIDGPCYQFREVCVDMLEGRIDHDSVFAIIYTLDPEDDWKDETVWVKANPNIGVTPTYDYMRSSLTAAIHEGATAEIEFKTKNLNLWTSTSTTWVSDDDWQACGSDWSLDILMNRDCYGGLDLGSVSDLTAFTLFFPATIDDIARTLHYFWVPENNIDKKSKEQRVDYRQWIDDELVFITPGNATDYKFIRKHINNLSSQFRIKAIAYDSWNHLSIVPDLVEDGATLLPFGQSGGHMDSPIKYLEKSLLDHQIDHRGNKVMRWMVSNVQTKIDHNGNVKFDKNKSRKKIDGPVSLAMAIGGWQRINIKNQKEQSVYNFRDPMVL